MRRARRLRQLCGVLLFAACLVGGGFSALASRGEPQILISHAFIRAPEDEGPSTMGYLTITSRIDDKLLSASSPDVDKIELHGIFNSQGLRRVHEVEEIPLPAGKAVALAPGGSFRLMLVGLKDTLKVGQRVPIDLVFAQAGTVRITAKVARLKRSAKGQAGN